MKIKLAAGLMSITIALVALACGGETKSSEGGGSNAKSTGAAATKKESGKTTGGAGSKMDAGTKNPAPAAAEGGW